MKNNMTGIILMVIGAILLGAGIYVFSTNKKQNVVTASNVEITKVEDVSNDTMRINATGSNDELGKIIEKAIADGFLSANERELIKKTAISKGEDYVKVIDDLEKRINLLETNSEADEGDLLYKKGLDFEKFVVKKFNRKLYKVKEWTGDKFVEGVYVEANQHPDLLMEFNGYKQKEDFAVECKWRQNIYMKGINISNPDQLNRYKDYAKKKKIPVFMALGLGGESAAPERLFIVPLQDISEPFMLISELIKYEKNVNSNFFFDYVKGELK